MKGLLLAAVLAAALAAPGATPAGAGGRIFVTTGYVGNSGSENGGWFQFAESSQRFRLPANPREIETYTRLITAAVERGVALRVRYDGSAGRADAAGGYVEYPLCSLAAPTGASFGDERTNCPPRPARASVTAERALALGLAKAVAEPAEARRLFGSALAGRRLPDSLRAVALRARGDAAEQIAENLPWAGDAYDRIIADGLADYRSWVMVAPNEPDAQYSVARMLGNLGGYPDALAVYRAIGNRWPDQAFLVAVRTGALYRRQGRYGEALRALDDYAAGAGVPEGMRFRYHRAWTLNLLERPREALDELRRGLETQPDYAYAYFMRACANAKLGQLRDALTDEERGMELLSGFAQDNPAGFAENLRRGRATVDELRTLIASHRDTATNAPCDRLWQREIRSRPRSALLGPAPG